MIREYQNGKYLISTDKRKLNLKVIHNFLTQSYWSKGITLDRVKRSINGALCFGLYYEGGQIGFARVITDYTNFGYLADVFVIQKYRGRGLSKWLMNCIVNHPELKDLKAWMLATKDAHGLYEKFGFKPLEDPARYMKRTNPKYHPKNNLDSNPCKRENV